MMDQEEFPYLLQDKHCHRFKRGKDRVDPADSLWWAFRIGVQKAGRALDVDNVAKTTIDAFSSWQIVKDQSTHSRSWGCSQTTPSTTCVSSRPSENAVLPTVRGSRYSPASCDGRRQAATIRGGELLARMREAYASLRPVTQERTLRWASTKATSGASS
jgi:hypothetical protein